MAVLRSDDWLSQTELNEEFLRVNNEQVNLDDSDETHFSPVSRGDAEDEAQRLQAANDDTEDTTYFQSEDKTGHGDDQQPDDYPDLDETFFEGADDILRSVNADKPDESAPGTSSRLNSSIFTQEADLGWSQSMDLVGHDGFSDWMKPASFELQKDKLEKRDDAEDLYVQMQDPFTQEFRIFRVPVDSGLSRSQTLRALGALNTLDTAVGCEPFVAQLQSSAPAPSYERTPGDDGDDCAPDTMTLFTQDLDWPQTVPSLDSPFHDQEQLPWPVWPASVGDQIMMDEIVASLSNMSFSLGPEDADVVLSDLRAPPPVDDAGLAPPAALASPPPSAPSPPRSSPTFSTTAHRRPWGRRSKAMRVPKVADGGSAAQRPDGKRKRAPTPGLGRRTASGSLLGAEAAQHAQAGSSSPRHKVRRINQSVRSASAARKSSKDRAGMIAVYTRLQELRFLMQDIVAGRQPLPNPAETGRMRQEVLEIIGSLSAAVESDSNRTGKAKLKKEQAQQVADKLLHQLQVLMENQESSEVPEECTESNPEECSWKDATNCASSTAATVVEPEGYESLSPKYRTPKRKQNYPKRTSGRRGRKPSGIKKKSENSTVQFYPEDKENCGDPNNDYTCNSTEEKSNEILTYESQELSNPTKEDIELIQGACCPSTEPSTNTEATSEQVDNSSGVQSEENFAEEQIEYQHLVNLIKMRAVTSLTTKKMQDNQGEKEDYIWRGGPLRLTGILLPKKSEFEPIHNLPPNFWNDPQAPIPQEWIDIIDWYD